MSQDQSPFPQAQFGPGPYAPPPQSSVPNAQPGPHPYTYVQGPPLPPPPLIPRRPSISSSASTIVMGVLALIAAAVSLAAVFLSRTDHSWVSSRLFLIGVGLGLVTLGVVLAVTAVRGKSGNWLTIASAVLAGIFIPIALIVGSVLSASYAFGGHGWDWTSPPPLTEESDPWASNNEDEEVDWTEEPDPISYVTGDTQTFDHESANIVADTSDITIDLTGAPSELISYIDVDLYDSSLTVLLRGDQSAVFQSGYITGSEIILDADAATLAAHPWVSMLPSLELRNYIESDAYLANGYLAPTVTISADASTVTFVVTNDEEPQS